MHARSAPVDPIENDRERLALGGASAVAQGRPSAETVPSARTRRRARTMELLRWAITLAVLVGAVWLFRHLDLRLLGEALARADVRLIGAAIALNLTANLFSRSMRWRALLPPSPRDGRPPPTRELAPVLLASQAALNVFPFRAGEAVRVLELQRRHGYAVTALVTVALTEKLVETTTIALYLIPAFGLPGASAWLQTRTLLLALAAIAIVAIVAVALVRKAARMQGSIGSRLAQRASDVARALGRPRAIGVAAIWSIVSDACDVGMILLVLRAVGIHQPIAAGCAILLAINVAIAVPSTPAQLGTFEAGALFALTRLGVSPDAATAFALLYHACHVVPTTLLGGAVLLASRRERRREAATAGGVRLARARLASGIDTRRASGR